MIQVVLNNNASGPIIGEAPGSKKVGGQNFSSHHDMQSLFFAAFLGNDQS